MYDRSPLTLAPDGIDGVTQYIMATLLTSYRARHSHRNLQIIKRQACYRAVSDAAYQYALALATT